MVTQIALLGAPALFAAPSTAVTYPNLGSQERTFQSNRLGLTLNLRLVVVGLNQEHDPQQPVVKDGLIHVALDLIVVGGKDFIQMEVLDTDFDAELQLLGIAKQDLVNMLGAQHVELGLVQQINNLIEVGLGQFVTLRHVAVGFDIGADLVELRVELALMSAPPPPDALATWTQFYANTLEPLIGTRQWAMAVDQRIGAALLGRVMAAALDADGRIHRETPVAANWDPNLPGYRTSVEGEVVDLCICAFGKIDLDVRIQTEISLSLQGEQARIDIRYSIKPTDLAEVACCGISAALYFPFLGFAYLLDGKINLSDYVTGLLLPTEVLMTVIAQICSYKPDGVPIRNCHVDVNDDAHFYCEIDIPSISASASCQGLLLSAGMSEIKGQGQNLVLAGQVNIPPIIDPQINLDITPFDYAPPSFSCSGGISRQECFKAFVRVFRAAGNYDFRVCKVHVLGVYKYAAKIEIAHSTCPYAAWITISLLVEQYDYTSVKVLIETTHGVLFGVIAPPANKVSTDEIQQARLHAALERISRCYAKQKRWDMHWLIDPAPYIDVINLRQIWMLAGVAAAETHRLEVVNEADRLLVTTDMQPGRAFRMTLIEPGHTLSIVQDAHSDAERLESADIHATQVLAAVAGRLAFDTDVVAIDAVRMSPVRTLLVHERDQVTIFEVMETGDLIRSRTLDTARAKWLGRCNTMLYAMNDIDSLLCCDLTDGTGWRQAPQNRQRSNVYCGCHSVIAVVNPNAQPPASWPVDVGQFSFLMYRTMTGTHVGTPTASIRNGFCAMVTSELTITQALDRTVRAGAQLHFQCPAQALITPLRSGTMLTVAEQPNQLELLRALVRQEL